MKKEIFKKYVDTVSRVFDIVSARTKSLREMEKQTSHIRIIVEDKTDNTIKVIITPTTTEWLSSNPRALDIKHIVESKLDDKYRYVSHQVDYSRAILLDLNLK
jgi:hypothetical protein